MIGTNLENQLPTEFFGYSMKNSLFMIEINQNKIIEAGEVQNFVGDVFEIVPEFFKIIEDKIQERLTVKDVNES